VTHIGDGEIQFVSGRVGTASTPQWKCLTVFITIYLPNTIFSE